MKRFIPPILVALAVAALWQVTVRIGDINPIVLPAPGDVALALSANLHDLLLHTAVTMTEAVLGFLIGSAGAILLAIVFVRWPVWEYAFYPYAIILKATPLIAIAPLLVIWFGNGMAAKVVMAALVAFFPVLVSAARGLRDIDQNTLYLMKSLSASDKQILRWVRIPQSMPYILSSLKIASTLAVVGAVIGEFTGATVGIGYLIKLGAYNLDTSLILAAVVMIGSSGVVFFGALALLERRLVFWRPLI